jgi:hypothetical protein
LGYQRGKTEDAINRIAAIQQAIKAVDDAIGDEGGLVSQGK